MSAALPPLPPRMRLIHRAFILLAVVQMAYSGWQVFVVLQPEGTIGPVFGRAADLPPEVMVARRLYAIEGWLALLGLALYLAVTEVLPTRLRMTSHHPDPGA
jgi:hypothetical protein